MKTTLLVSACLLPFVASMTSCEKKGPAEKLGEKIDNAADELNPKGPGEKLGEKLDNATGN